MIWYPLFFHQNSRKEADLMNFVDYCNSFLLEPYFHFLSPEKQALVHFHFFDLLLVWLEVNRKRILRGSVLLFRHALWLHQIGKKGWLILNFHFRIYGCFLWWWFWIFQISGWAVSFSAGKGLFFFIFHFATCKNFFSLCVLHNSTHYRQQ